MDTIYHPIRLMIGLVEAFRAKMCKKLEATALVSLFSPSVLDLVSVYPLGPSCGPEPIGFDLLFSSKQL